jgi:hypothetical protein
MWVNRLAGLNSVAYARRGALFGVCDVKMEGD